MSAQLKRLSLPVILAGGLALWLGAIRDSDSKRLESAREAYLEDLDRARAQYQDNVADAQQTLRRHYETLISRYESRRESDAAASLKVELDEFLASHSAEVVAAGEGSGGEAAGDGHQALIEAVGPAVVDSSGQMHRTNGMADKQYMLLYFSAEWCPPCRGFTPELVKYVRKNRSGDNFDLLFVSSDRSERDQLNYMRSYKMSWAAVPHDRINPSGLKQKYGGSGIPNLVVVDPDGNKVLSSYNDRGQYVGPRHVLNEFDKLLAQN